MADQFCVRVSELAISLVGAASIAVEAAIVPWLGAVMLRVEQYLSAEVSIQNAFVEEKECALVALKNLSVGCSPVFHPWLSQCSNLLDYLPPL